MPSALPALKLPYLCRGRFLLRAIVLSQAVAVVLSFAPGINTDAWYRLGLISLFVHWVVLLSTGCLCWLRPQLNKLPAMTILGCCTFIFIIITVAISSLAYHWLHAQNWPLSQSLAGFLLANSMIAFIISMIAIQFFIMHGEHSEQLAAQNRAELSALQARIQPHFLFNSLNTVAELTQIDANSAEKALLDLAALFRAALHVGEALPLAQELQLAKQYLSLEQWRLGSRMQVDWQLPETIPDINIPVLTIQPLLENAVRHGIESCQDNALLRIQLLESRTAVSFVITNPFQQLSANRPKNGIAMENIRQRLKLHYGQHASLTYSVTDNVFRVKLVLPRA
ncbi:sensor histidine kinase [Rheinheimera salexigens]|uniref:Histidine kinase n=1 Tax=Rheinheimera salexigens TaxID=1628148 RepID=A0A1E7Q9H9_9GAMM|nr:histidine kinase [Rheinheimera salexigens]OEY70713.1 histidine kinase [Rheinheimera salexigens]